MSIGLDDLQDKYRRMNDAALIDLARDYDSLTDTAQAALRAEFSARGLEPPLVDDPPQLDLSNRKLVTVKRFRDLSEAIVARSLLESAGIRVYLYDENTVRLDWQISNMIGGIRVQVEDKDEQEAAAILNQPMGESFTMEDGSEFEQPRCPVCQSLDITFQGASRGPALMSWLVIGAPVLPTGEKTWRCNACGARWEDTDES